MNKKAGLIGWVLLFVLVLFGLVFYGLIGKAQAEKANVTCEINYGVLCFKWEGNESFGKQFQILGDESEVSIVPK